MSTLPTHIVHKLNLEIEVPGEAMARRMYRDGGSFVQEYVLPKLEAIFRQFDREDEHIRLETLDIILHAGNGRTPEETIRKELAKAVGERLDALSALPKEGEVTKEVLTNKRSGASQVIEAFLHYLGTGIAPWWLADTGTLSDTELLIRVISRKEEQFIPMLLHKLQEEPAVLRRLLLQYDQVLLRYVYSLLAPPELFSIASRYEELLAIQIAGTATAETVKQAYWSLVWRLVPFSGLASVDKENFASELEQRLPRLTGAMDGLRPGSLPDTRKSGQGDATADVVSATQLPPVLSDRSGRPTDSKPGEEQPQADNAVLPEGLIVSNAGLVLLHPFFQYFFIELGLMQETQFVDLEARETAAHLLHYLATGAEQAQDVDMVFEKYLCGLNRDHITYRFITLTERMRSEGALLLQSAIRHWTVLKQTSEQGLQEAFLQRKGKLMASGAQHRLVMEKNAMDILLEQIPWNIGLLKLPWMDQMLHVDWTS